MGRGMPGWSCLCFDIATRTGWAFWETGLNIPLWGSFHLGNGEKAIRFLALGDQTEGLCRKLKPKMFSFERPNAHLYGSYKDEKTGRVFGGRSNRNTIEYLCALCGVAEEHAHRAGIPAENIKTTETTETRRHFIQASPKRVIAKQQTVLKCRDLGWDVDNDDEADALAQLSFMRSLYDPMFAVEATPLFQTIGRKGER